MTLDFNRAIFIDSSNLEEIKKWNSLGVVDGVTTNQLIMLKDGIKPKNFEKVIRQICEEMKDKPVSVELTDSTAAAEEMVKEAHRFNRLSDNIVVKVPMIPNTVKSLQIIRELVKNNIAVNVTTMMTFEQMVMAILGVRHSKKNSFVSVFWGRSIEDHAKYRSRSDFMAQYPRVGNESVVNVTPQKIVSTTAAFIKEGGWSNVKIIVGSIRTAAMVGEAYDAGGHIVTISPDVLLAMLFSQRSIETIQQFDQAWRDLQKANKKNK